MTQTSTFIEESKRDSPSRYWEEALVVLSDELNDDSEGEERQMGSREKPGNAQFLETPRVQQQMDFRLVDVNAIFGKKKEVYRMKLEKLSTVDCQLC